MTTATAERDFILEGTAERPETVSQSLLARLNVCPASGYLYLKHKGGPQSHAMARGQAFHAFTEQATRQMMEMGELTMPGEVARDLQQSIIDERTDLVLPAAEQDVCRLMAWQWAEATILDLSAIVAVEQTLTLEMSGWTVRGRLDFAEIRGDEAWIKDYKTSLHIDTQEDTERSFQLLMYGLLFAYGEIEGRPFPLGQGIDTFHLSLVFPRYTAEADGSLIEKTVTVTRAQLAEHQGAIKRLLRILEEGLKSGEWQASSGSHCPTCPARQECPIPDEYHLFEDIETGQDAERMAEEWFQNDARNRKRKAALRKWAVDYGPIYFGDYALDFQKIEQKPRVKDWGALTDGVARFQHGESFDLEDYRTKGSVSSKFDKRKKRDDE